MSTKYIVIVPDEMSEAMMNAALLMRQRAGEAQLGQVYIEVQTELPEVADARKPVKRAARGTRTAKPAVIRAEAPAAPARAARNSVVYQPVRGVDPDSVSPAQRRILLYLINSRMPLSAQAIQAWLASQDHTTPEAVRKSVESSLHGLRSRGAILSVEA